MISSNFPAFIISLIARKYSVYAALKAAEHTLNNLICKSNFRLAEFTLAIEHMFWYRLWYTPDEVSRKMAGKRVKYEWTG